MRKTPLLAALALGVATALALAGCSGASSSSSNGGSDASIAIGSLYEPQNLDNTAGGGQGVTEALNGNVYEGLFKLTDDGKVEPLLATKYKTSADGLTYTFTLRDGVKFHSGKPLTSADVKCSIERVTADDSQSARKSQLAVISTIDTPDDKTVVDPPVVAARSRCRTTSATSGSTDRATRTTRPPRTAPVPTSSAPGSAAAR